MPSLIYDAEINLTIYYKEYSWNYTDEIFFTALDSQNKLVVESTMGASPSDYYDSITRYRQQNMKLRLPLSTRSLRVFSKTLQNPWSIANISLKILHCPEGSQKISTNKCGCKVGYYKDSLVNDLVCLECPTHCKSCTGKGVNECTRKEEYLNSNFLNILYIFYKS